MKISPHAFTRFWDVHAWSGVIGGLVLYLMFVTGGITLFHHELELWQEPLAQQAAAPGPHQAVLDRALAQLPTQPDNIWLYPKPLGAAQIGYTEPGTETWRRYWIDGPSGRLIPERERLADFLYGLHFLWHDATGDWLYRMSGFLAVALLLAIVTGVLIHLKDIVRQFHQFRPDRSRRVLWSDMHKVLGVMGLPFQLLYAYTGALIVLGPLLLGAFAGPLFGGDRQRAEAALWGDPGPPPSKTGPPATGFPLDELAARARAAGPGLLPESYRILHPGRENAVVDVRGPIEGTTPRAYGAVRLAASDGKILHVDSPATETAGGATWRWVAGLHYAYFGGPLLRVMFFALALATCITILTGNWIWLARREARRASMGNRVLARLTAGFGVGTPVAVAVMFLVSRLFPLEWSARGTAEELTFLGVLALCTGWAFVARDEATVWWQGLAAAGAAPLPVPLLAARWSDAGLFGTGPRIGTVVGVDVALLATSFALLVGALALRAVCIRNRATNVEHADDPATAHELVIARAERDALET